MVLNVNNCSERKHLEKNRLALEETDLASDLRFMKTALQKQLQFNQSFNIFGRPFVGLSVQF